MTVDANVLVFFHVVNPAFTPQATRAIERAERLRAPEVWRSELRSALMRYVRIGETDDVPGSDMTLDEAVKHMADAETIVDETFRVDSGAVLRLAYASGCSPYDCEYVQLAQKLNTRLLTYDGPVLDAFPKVALRPGNFVPGA